LVAGGEDKMLDVEMKFFTVVMMLFSLMLILQFVAGDDAMYLDVEMAGGRLW
jgi:hypothetical protein